MSEKNKILYPLLSIYFLFWFISCLTPLLLFFSQVSSLENVKDATLASAIWLFPILLFPDRARFIAGLIACILWIFVLPSFSYFLIYRQELSESLLFILFESNQAESLEYLKNYFSFYVFAQILLFAAVTVWIWSKIPKYFQLNKKNKYLSLILIGLMLFTYPVKKGFAKNSFEVFKHDISKHISSAPPWQLLFGYSHYLREVSAVNHFLGKLNKIPPLEDLNELEKPLPTTAVIVIGESSSRLHFSLYGYQRNTNPMLATIKDQLFIFNNVYSSRPYTIESLEQVLSFADQLHPDLYKSKPTLVSMMKQAGYKTFWISNQQSLTSRNTILTSFAKQADIQIWTNSSRSQNYSYNYDEKILQPFSDVLSDDSKKKLIIVHLLGTHMSYKYRYPSSYNFFTDNTKLSKELSDHQVEIIDEYDNAIRYNDMIIYQLIQRLNSKKQHSVLVYFSDHGEDVFDAGERNFQGRNEASPTLPIYAIPFIVWTSKNWFNQSLLRNPAILSRQFDNSQFIYAWSHLLGIDYKGFSEAQSIFSNKFLPDEIIVGNPYQPEKLKKLEYTQ